jgi:CheY-like chemotaxis protein
VDPNPLELALLNVIFNARDSMPDGGSIVISARPANPQEEAEIGSSPLVCLEVADDGHGMSEEVRNRAFEPYFTTKPVGHGSGLGLSHAQAFARQSGGDARLSSEPGKGTRVRFYLPATRETPAAVEPTRQDPVPARALSILMVEDDLLVSSVVVPALEAAGHRVTLAATADEALANLDGDLQFDVLFTDVVMPGKLTGMDLVAWCTGHRPDLPTVVATGYSAQQDEGAYEVLRKPYGIEQLLRVLQAAVNADRSMPAGGQESS